MFISSSLGSRTIQNKVLPSLDGMPTLALFGAYETFGKLLIIPIAEAAKKSDLLSIVSREMPRGIWEPPST